MAFFDRFDICEAHYTLENSWNIGGWLSERQSNIRRKEATHVQLDRIKFKCSRSFNGFESLSENGKEIYSDLCTLYGFNDPDVSAWIAENNEWIADSQD